MPPCITRYSDPQFYFNEISCYANWKVDKVIECSQLFDPEVDVINHIDESDGTTEYEICLMNKQAQFETCLFALYLHSNAACYTEFTKPCYDEYDITGDDEALQMCLEGAAWEIEACQKEAEENFYFQYLNSN